MATPDPTLTHTFTFHLTEADSFSVRAVVRDGEPWFVAADVCAALDHSNVTMALKRLDDEEQALNSIEGASNGLPVNMINESGLYSLILGSRKPSAKVFKRWVTSEVLPSIRKTGAYAQPSADTGLSHAEAAALLAECSLMMGRELAVLRSELQARISSHGRKLSVAGRALKPFIRPGGSIDTAREVDASHATRSPNSQLRLGFDGDGQPAVMEPPGATVREVVRLNEVIGEVNDKTGDELPAMPVSRGLAMLASTKPAIPYPARGARLAGPIH